MGRSRALLMAPVLAGSLAAGAFMAAPADAVTAPVKVVSDCQTPHYKPTSLIVFCGDGGGYLVHAHWKTWTTRGATGTASFMVNACVPDCAQGTFHAYPVNVTLDSPHGRPLVFHRLVMGFTDGQPAGYGRIFRLRLYPA